MTDQPEPQRDALAEHREALAGEFLRIAEHRPRCRWPRRLAIPAIAVPLMATAGLALAGEGPFAESTLNVAPAPAPLFVGEGATYPECPAEVQQSIEELTDVAAYTRTPGYPVPGCPTVQDLSSNASVVAEIARRAEQAKRATAAENATTLNELNAAPAPPPLFVGEGAAYPECPAEVQQSIEELTDVAAYTRTPGYPVPGCPTVEALRSNASIVAEINRRALDSNGERAGAGAPVAPVPPDGR